MKSLGSLVKSPKSIGRNMKGNRWPVSGDRARSLVAAQAGGCPHRDAARALDAIKLDGAQMAA